jgi:xanthine/CO dehydrogenase XdhC/CoxF family maturation factor
VRKDARDVLAAARGAFTVATVVRVRGSSYRRPGARMLVDAHGVIAGSVSGGCLEGQIARRGRWWAEAGPVVRRFTSEADADDDDRAATGCGGTVEILIENEPSALDALRWVAARRVAACIATVLPSARRAAVTATDAWGDPRLVDVARRALATGGHAWSGDVFVEYLPAPRELLVCGRHHDVAPLVRLCRMMGWEVTVAAGGVAARALGEPDATIALDAGEVAAWAAVRPEAAIVVMTHAVALDRELLAALDRLPVAYLGVLGPRRRLGEVAARVRAPIGLDLGGDGPEAVALSVAAEVQAVWERLSGTRTVSLASVG